MKIFKGIAKYIIILILFSLLISYCNLQIAMYIRYAIDGILFHNLEEIPKFIQPIVEMDIIRSLIILSGIIMGIRGILVFVNYIRERITTKFTLKISANLKEELYAHILKLEYDSYYSYSKVEMLQRVNEDAKEYSNFFKVQFNVILDIVSLSIFIVTQGVTLNVSITIFLLVTIVVMLLFALWYYRKMTQMLETLISKKKQLLGATIQNIHNFKFVRIYNRQKKEIQQYKKLNQNYTKEDIKFIKFVLFYEIISEHITYLKNPICYLLGGISIINGNMTLGALTALILLSDKILWCLYSFGENLEVVDTFFVVRKKIKALMDLKEETENNYHYNLDGEIVFHNVSINISEREILRNLNFCIKKGEKVAIIGENGTGKSMIARAIIGIGNIEGDMYLNYHNVKQLDKSNIREYIEYISGEGDVFIGTITENILLWEKKSQEELENVIKEVAFDKDIKQLEQGYQTLIGEKGVKLSGGQKQRILIARALMRKKPIMIFDNAFSKLDGKTSNQILKNLTLHYPETTMIFITHKPEIRNYVDKCINIRNKTSAIEKIEQKGESI